MYLTQTYTSRYLCIHTSVHLHISILCDKSSTILKNDMRKRVKDEQTREGAKNRPVIVRLVDIINPSGCNNSNRQEESDTLRAVSKCTGNCTVTANTNDNRQLVLQRSGKKERAFFMTYKNHLNTNK